MSENKPKPSPKQAKPKESVSPLGYGPQMTASDTLRGFQAAAAAGDAPLARKHQKDLNAILETAFG